jgi:hypothetical protein
MLDKLGGWPLGNIATLLNWPSPSPLRDELRELFRHYRESGPNLKRMMDSDQKLARTLRDMWTVRVVFTDSGFADLQLYPRGISYPAEYTDHYKAIQIFGRLILNREWAKLDGPCSRCGKYFVRQRQSFRIKEHVYCSRECSATATAMASAKAKREVEYAAKLKRAESARQQWKPGGLSFKEFVRKETGLTLTWITQAINCGKLREPYMKRRG